MASRIAGFRHGVAKNHFQRHFSEDLLLSSFYQPANRDFGATSNGRLAWVPDLLGQWRVAKPKAITRKEEKQLKHDNMQWLGKSWNYERYEMTIFWEKLRSWPVRWMTSQARTCRPVCHSGRILKESGHIVTHHLFNNRPEISDTDTTDVTDYQQDFLRIDPGFEISHAIGRWRGRTSNFSPWLMPSWTTSRQSSKEVAGKTSEKVYMRSEKW